MDIHARQFKLQGAGQVVKDHNKRSECGKGLQDADAEPQGIFHEQADVFTDTLVRVVCGRAEHLEAVIGLMLQPFVDIPVGEPAAPVDDQHLLQVKSVHGQNNINKCQPAEMKQLGKNFFFLIILQGAVKNIVPLVQLHQHEHYAQGQDDDCKEQQVRLLFLFTLPV